MAKSLDNTVIDAALTVVAGSTNITVCSADPVNFAGIAAVALATTTLAGGDFTIADGDVSGRKLTIAEQATVTIDATGTATHLAHDDGATLLALTTTTSLSLTSGGTVDIPLHKLEIADPA